MRIDLTENFDDTLGLWDDYDAYDFDQRERLRTQKHTDLRTFYQGDIVGATIGDLDLELMSDLEGVEVGSISGTVIVNPDEAWRAETTGEASWSYGSDALFSNYRTLRLMIGEAGDTTVYSTMADYPVDVSSYEDDDLISITVAEFPLAALEDSSGLLIGDSDLDIIIPFTQSLNTLVDGNLEILLPVSSLGDLDRTNIVKVGFFISTTGVATFCVAGLRVIDKDWEAGSVEIDTRYGRLQKLAPRSGDSAALPEFTQPVVWRSSNPPELDDPKPINTEFGVLFGVGDLSGTNEISLYFRELTEDFLTMGDLDGFTMGSFDGGPQPDVGSARFNPVTQSDLEIFTQSDLEARTQIEIERTPDSNSSSWIQFQLQWQAGSETITIKNTEDPGYTFSTGGLFEADGHYLFLTRLEETEARAYLYEVDVKGNILSMIYDTRLIADDSQFKRRKGRFGWYADLEDPTASIDSIRERGSVFAEYRSLPFESKTPVVGAELFATTTPKTEQYQYFVPGYRNGPLYSTVERDTNRSTSGESWRITNQGSQTYQGVMTNVINIVDFENTEIEFDMYWPSPALDAGSTPTAFLVDDKYIRQIPLLLPNIIPDQWQHIRILLSSVGTELTGNYRVAIVDTRAIFSTWWIDKMSVSTRTISWDGRAVVDDPWKSNDARWTPFRNVLNQSRGGILFERRGNQVQVRAQARDQSASISRIQFKPKYAELGKFKSYASPAASVLPTADFDSVVDEQLVTFTDTSTDSDGIVINTEWNFGDGATGVGRSVKHLYSSPGTYTVAIIVTDDNGNKSTSEQTVVV